MNNNDLTEKNHDVIMQNKPTTQPGRFDELKRTGRQTYLALTAALATLAPSATTVGTTAGGDTNANDLEDK